MILLTRLDNSKILVNLETIRYVESTPDTLIHFTNGDSLLVRDTLQEFEASVIDYKVRILSRLNQTKS